MGTGELSGQPDKNTIQGSSDSPSHLSYGTSHLAILIKEVPKN